jgi:signal peptidase II
MRQKDRVGLGRLLLFCSIALGGLAFDLVTKSIVFARIGPPPAPSVPVIPHVLELRLSRNTGALWGLGADLPGSSLIFAGLSVVAALIICYTLFIRGAASNSVWTVALGLIMAGALGNCYDRLALGYVRDFVYFHVDPIHFECAIFNFADNMLVIGAVTLVLYALRPDQSQPEAVTPSQVADSVLGTNCAPSSPHSTSQSSHSIHSI